MELNQIFKNNEEWIAKTLSSDPGYFERLSAGQTPKYLYIGCSDSRVTAETVMGAKPGEVFVHRNIANLAPNNDLNVLSVIVYAVKYLKVSNIIICGHYGCGGVKAAMSPDDLGIMNPWLRNIRDVFRMHEEELVAIEDDNKRYERLIELNVIEQCINVAKLKEVQIAFREREIKIHGWVFDLASGRIVDQKVNTEEIMKKIERIYKFNI